MTVCLWVCVHTSVYVCVWVTLSTVRIMYACVPKYEYVNPFLWPFSHILLHESSIYACTHTHTSPFLSTLKCGQGVKFLISADPHMPWCWYAGPALTPNVTHPHPSIWYTHWLKVGVTHKWLCFVTVWPTTCEESREGGGWRMGIYAGENLLNLRKLTYYVVVKDH